MLRHNLEDSTKSILWKEDGRASTGLIWLMIGKSGVVCEYTDLG
jgi:hypothetical protein